MKKARHRALTQGNGGEKWKEFYVEMKKARHRALTPQFFSTTIWSEYTVEMKKARHRALTL